MSGEAVELVLTLFAIAIGVIGAGGSLAGMLAMVRVK
jgi:hypothetical protein